MKAGHNAIYTLVMIILCLCFGVSGTRAQETVDANIRVKFINEYNNKESYKSVLYRIYATEDAANDVVTAIKRVSNKSSDDFAAITAMQKILKEKKIVSRSKSNGRFTRRGLTPGMAIVVVAEEDQLVDKIVIKAGQTDYEVVFKIKELTNVIAKGTKKPIPRTTIVETDNGMEQFKIHIPIDKKLIRDASRLVIQTYAVDCSTEDTISYCEPIVYEGGTYHALQDKRMDFDFFKNDKLAYGFRSTIEQPAVGDYFFVDTTIIYTKPDIHKSYKGPCTYAIEDYHRVYYKDAFGGSCLRIRPFKFLDFSVAIPEMPLTEEFQEIADQVTENVKKDLRLRFLVGKDILTEDSINDIERDKLVKELRSYGDDLLTPTIIGTASPDGGDKINSDLAQKRAQRARSIIAPFLSRRATPHVSTKIYTWDEVADELEKKRMKEQAQAVREIIAANGNNNTAIHKAVQKLDFYETEIVKILEDMRVMKCEYSYIKEHVMDADEAVEVYYRDKKAFLSGEKKFSSGDYYNLYATIEDSLELDTITVMAYNYLKTRPDIYGEKIAPYVYNRMARMMMRVGAPDTTILTPFIDQFETDTTYNKVDWAVNRDGSVIKMNRSDLLVTQAMCFYNLQKFKRAMEFVAWIKTGKNVPTGLDKLEKFINLKNYFGINEDCKEFQDAKKFVLESSKENKAILLTEIPEWRISFEDTDDLITRLDNNNPKKWYLKGILWAEKSTAAGTDDLSSYYVEEESDGFRLLSQNEENDLISKDYSAFEEYEKKKKIYLEEHKDDVQQEPVNTQGVKHYLAYFHQSFKLQPSFKGLYYNEGHVTEEMRKSARYLKKDFAAYEEIFKLLQIRDDRRKEELSDGQTENKDEEKSVETTADDDKEKSSTEVAPSDKENTSADETTVDNKE